MKTHDFTSPTFLARLLLIGALTSQTLVLLPLHAAETASLPTTNAAANSWVSVSAKPSLGATTKDVRNAAGVKGILVEKVQDQGTAKTIGLLVGDVILAVDGNAVADSASLVEKLEGLKVGESVRFKIERAGKIQELKGALGGVEAAASPTKPIAVGTVAGNAIVLPAASKIELIIEEPISSNKSKKNDEVFYTVQNDVRDPNGKVLIRAGAKGGGTVTEAKGSGAFGKKGKLEFTAEWVESVDGQKLPLRSSLEASGKSNQTVAIATMLFLSVLGGFIKGKNITLDKGTPVVAYLNADANIVPAV